MKKLLLLLIVGGVGFVLCALMGYINVPGLTPPASTPTPQAEKLEPPKAESPAEKPAATPSSPRETPRPTAPAAPKASSTPSVKKSLYPPIQPSDVERAKALYAKADWSGVARALDGCEKPEIEDGPSTTDARKLVRKARLLDALTQKIKRNPLATAKKLEQISLNNGGTMIGVVTEVGDRLKIYRMGNVEAEVKADDVGERIPASRDVFKQKLLERLRDKESRMKGDDAFAEMRLGHFCWEYGLDPEAVPYFDRAVESDDFPVIARVFGGGNADKLVDGWYVFSGKPRPGQGPATDSQAASTPAPKPAEPAATPSASGGPANVAAARSKYDLGVEQYKRSFGDSNEAQAALKKAHEYFKQARDALGDGEDSASEELRTQIARLLFDCSKRMAVQ